MQAENSMIKDVMIRVTSLQRNDSGQDEKISLETPGKFGIQKGFSYITYQETELTGMEGTTTSLRFYPDSVNLVRVGKSFSSRNISPVKSPIHNTKHRSAHCRWASIRGGWKIPYPAEADICGLLMTLIWTVCFAIITN